jgi:hypothetical protein
MKEVDGGVLGFVSSVISALAWPVTLLACVLLLRKYFQALVPLVRTVKYSDVEISFGREIAELAKTSDASVGNHQLEPNTREWEELMRTAEIRPRTAIRMAFKQVESAVSETARKLKIEITEAASGMPMVVGALLLNRNAISGGQYELLYKLRELLNEADTAPPDSLSAESATEFVALALRLAASIRS